MSFLDNNNVNIRFNEKLFTIADGLTGSHTDTVYCTGFKTALIFVTNATSDLTISAVGVNKDKVSSVSSQFIRAVEVTNVAGGRINNPFNIGSNRVLKSGTVHAIKVDVDTLYALRVTLDSANTYSATCVMTNDNFDFDYNQRFYKFVSAVKFDGNNAKIRKTLFKGKFAVAMMNLPSAISSNLSIRAGSTNITPNCVDLDTGTTLRDGIQKYDAGQHRIAIPLNDASYSDEITFEFGDNATTMSLYLMDFDGDVTFTDYGYFNKISTTLGSGYNIAVPEGKNVALVKVSSAANAKFTAYMTTPTNSTRTPVSEAGGCIFDVNSGSFVGDTITFNGSGMYVIDVSKANNVAFSSDISTTDFSLSVSFDVDEKIVPAEIINHGFKTLYESKKFKVSKNLLPEEIEAVYKDVVVWRATNGSYILVSLNGFNGPRKKIVLNATNFPGLKANSAVEQVVIMPWTRNPTTSYPGNLWRMNVITTRNQVYHNFPSRAVSGDGTYVAGDEYKFDESVIWELPERFAPVATKTGDDAVRIATGVYRFYPGLKDEAYSFHPAINSDNGYGNGGFPDYITKTNESGVSVKFARWCHYDDTDNQSNSFGFMGGFAANEKLAFLGTYKQNQARQTRMCVFVSNDGGRQWFCRWESGSQCLTIDYNGQRVRDTRGDLVGVNAGLLSNPLVLPTSTESYSGEGLTVREKRNSIPTAASKENCRFLYKSAVQVSSVAVNSDGNIVVTTSAAHSITNGGAVVFESSALTDSDYWSWIVNNGVDTSAGKDDGMAFIAKVTSTTTFVLCADYQNPHNPLFCRHVHAINHCKDGWSISCGEFYPQGWLFYVPVYESDEFTRKYPWDTLDFVRLTSSVDSVQRPLGFVIRQDAENTVIVGVDNEFTKVDNGVLPEGRTGDGFRRSSQGVWKGPLVGIDSAASYKCIFESDQVCYLFKDILGMMLYLGQMGHLGMSLDNGDTWDQCDIGTTGVCRLAGNLEDGTVVIENYVIKKNN